jgi:hypothetical protein
MLLKLKNSPRTASFRRYLAYVDLVIITLLVVGFVTRTTGEDLEDSVYENTTPSNAHMLVFAFSLLLA